VAKAELDSAAFSNVKEPEAFRKDLLNIARTTLSSKILTGTASGSGSDNTLLPAWQHKFDSMASTASLIGS